VSEGTSVLVGAGWQPEGACATVQLDGREIAK